MAKLVRPNHTRSLAFAYIRFSTVDQKKGDSARRQIAAAQDWCEKQDPPLVLDESLHDEGLSAYHGEHRKRGALGRFIERVKAGDIQPGSVLIVEAFDRLDRRSPRLAQEQFLTIINSGIDIVTLIDGQRFSGASIDANIGQLYTTIGMMIGAHASSANTAKRMAESFAQRRGTARTMVPSWIIKTVDGKPVQSVRSYPSNTVFGWAVDEAKAAIIKRIFRDILIKGTDLIAKELNVEGVPLLCTRKRLQRRNAIWNRSTVQKLVRGRQVVGYQSVGRMVDGQRKLTDQSIRLYPGVVSEKEWEAAQAALDGRKSGTRTGRNVTNFSNLFGHIAQCSVCGERLKIAQIGRTRKFKYMACSASLHRNCTHTRYHRTDKIEAEVFALFGGLTWETEARDDKIPTLQKQLNIWRKAKTDLQESLDGLAAAFKQSTPMPIIASMTKLAQQIEAHERDIRKLERQLATAMVTKPADHQLALVQSISRRLERLSGAELAEARGKIAAALPNLIDRLVFCPDGQITATLTNGVQIDLGTVSGHAVTDGFQIGPSITRAGQPRAPVSTMVPFKHPPGANEARYKQSGEALKAFKASQRKTERARRLTTRRTSL